MRGQLMVAGDRVHDGADAELAGTCRTLSRTTWRFFFSSGSPARS